jgi:hypothetical protein
MRTFVLTLAILAGIAMPAHAQQTQACSVLATSIPQATVPMVTLEKSVGSLDWDTILPHISGPTRANALLAKQTQVDFLRVLRQYRISLEAVSSSAQRCAS